MPLRESRKDDPAGTFDHSTALVSLLSPHKTSTPALEIGCCLRGIQHWRELLTQSDVFLERINAEK